MNNNAKFRVFEPFIAYIKYLKRNKIPFQSKTVDSARCIEFSAKDRFEAVEDYFGLCRMSGYISETRNGKETVLQWL